MKIISSKIKIFYTFCISFVFIFIGSVAVLTVSNSFQSVYSQGYIPPPITTSKTQNDQIANNNNNNPSTANTIGSSSSNGQSQLNLGQQPGSNCNTTLMVNCGSFNPSNTTTSTNQPPQTSTSETPNTGSIGSNTFNPNQPFTTQNPNTNLGKGSTNQLVNPNAFNYQINPATPSVDISKDPTQKINSIVTNSFGQGVPNLPVNIQVKDPSGKTAFLSTGKTDNDGKNVVSFPVKTVGTWTAIVAISSSAVSGGSPFGDQITWNAVSGSNSSNLTALVNLARTTVTLSDDPRDQILTTVKDPAGNGVKDIPLRIKITNPDAVSKTFSRITDSHGVDQFVIPVDKVGNWVALLTLIDPNGKTVPITSVAWNAVP